MKNASRRVAPGLLVLLGCGAYPETKGADSGSAQIPEGACSPEVTIPTGLLIEDEGIPADAHADTLGSAPEPQYVRYQWPDSDPSNSAAFLWNTGPDTLASVVQIGEAATFPDGAREVEGYSFAFGGTEPNVGDQRVHEVRLCGTLTPGTTYSYRVGGEGAWSDTHTFTTPGAPGSFDTFRIAVAGDSRGAYTTWEQIVTKMDAHDPDFILFSGDMVDTGGFQHEWEQWLAAGGDVIARRPIVTAHGNHEFLAQNYFAQFALPGNEQWFSVEYGSLALLVLNDTVQASEELTDEQPAFISSVLSETERPWRIAVHHQSAYAACSTHGSDTDVREAWVPVFEEHGVDIVFAGHNHIYERSKPIREDSESADGVTYIVTGGAGAPLYTGVDKAWFNEVATPVEHYIIADVGPDSMEVVVRDLDDNVIDEFTLRK